MGVVWALLGRRRGVLDPPGERHRRARVEPALDGHPVVAAVAAEPVHVAAGERLVALEARRFAAAFERVVFNTLSSRFNTLT